MSALPGLKALGAVWTPGAGQVGPQLQPGAAPLAGWPEPLIIRMPLVAVLFTPTNAAFVGVTTGTARARIKIPSSKLVVTFSLTFEPTIQATIGSYTSSAWSATLVRPAYDGGKEGDLHALFTSQTLPQGYQLEGALADVRVSAALAIPQVASADVEGVWALVAAFENSVPMCTDELKALHSRCVVSVDRQLQFDAT